jgi:lysozyme
MAKMSPSPANVKEESSSNNTVFLKIIAKNFLSVPSMARDLNVAGQNIAKLVKMRGGTAATGADMHFLKSGELEKKLEVQKEKYSPKPVKTTPTPAKGESFITGIKAIFTPKNFIRVLGKLALPALIITTLWQGFTGAWDKWKETGSIWEAFKGGISEIVDFFTFGLISKDDVSGLMDNIADFFKPVTDAVSNFFSKFSDWFTEKFNVVREFLGLPPPKPKAIEVPVDREAERIRKENEEELQRRREELRRLEIAERNAQYTGEDEIVRERMNLQKKSAKVAAEELRVAEEQAAAGRPVRAAAPGARPPTAPSKEAAPKVPTPTGDDKWIMDMIKKHEGVRTKPYKDSLGLWTVGVGHLIGDGKSLPPEWNREFTMEEIDALFAKDYEHHKKQAEKTPGYDKANERGRGALIDLAFNMGGAWYKKFKNAANALAAGDFNKAAEELTDSMWYKQVKGRAQTIVAMIRDGLGGGPTKMGPGGVDTAPIQVAAPTPSAPSGGAAPSGGGSLASLVKTQSGVDISGFQSEFEKRVAAMAADFKAKTGKTLLVTSGYRSNEKQKELFDKALAANGGDVALTRKKVAEPMPPLGKGRGSQHLQGLAVDINSKGADGLNTLAGPRDRPTGWLEAFGLIRPVPGEDWHVQPNGAAPTPDNPNNPGAPIAVAGKSGKATDVSSGKAESISPSPKAQGSEIASTSASVAADQRAQQKPQTPIVVNAPVTNNQVVKKTEVAAAGNPNKAPAQSTAQLLTARVA